MGWGKIDHIRAFTNELIIRTRWTAQFGHPPSEEGRSIFIVPYAAVTNCTKWYIC